MQNKIVNFGPAGLSNSAADILNCNVTSLTGPVGFTLTQPYILIRHIHIANTTGSAATFTLYKGATGGSAAGTEIYKAVSIAANSYWDGYPSGLRLDSTNFLTGLASAASNTLVISMEGEVGFS